MGEKFHDKCLKLAREIAITKTFLDDERMVALVLGH